MNNKDSEKIVLRLLKFGIKRLEKRERKNGSLTVREQTALDAMRGLRNGSLDTGEFITKAKQAVETPK